MTANLEWRRVSPQNEDLHQLIDKLDLYLQSVYPPEEIFVLDFSDPHIEETLFLMAYLGEQPVACGAYKPLGEEMAELKRIFVDPEFRNRGLASKLIAELERLALEQQIRIMRLETGEGQPEAVRLYEKLGYAHIPRYGEYRCCDSSICMEKVLTE
ncbi:GNAT family N-acetyltransferase [Gorillibacterium sp. CAU 1737]|uniref:GNAT family N-acetyltransferase n=1 Tax=Gorillibacterium sp. CAU 1737 TaxID=3140362 RepID=UPI003260BEC9